jgi:two-component system, LytTR family, sensor kinase
VLTHPTATRAFPADRRVRALLLAVPWLVLPLLFAPGAVLLNGPARPGMFVRSLEHYSLTFLPWILFSWWVHALTQRLLRDKRTAAGLWLGHVGLWFALSLLHALLLAVLDEAGFNVYGPEGMPIVSRLPRALLHAAPLDCVLYCAVVATSIGYTALRRYYDRERLLVEAQLIGLRAQLQPHFLFNVLNALSELVHRDPHAAESVITQLGRLLRRFVDQAQHVHSLRDELALLLDYVSIQKLLLGPRLRFHWEISEDALNAQVPATLLQPILENAIRHGIARTAHAGHVAIHAAIAAGETHIEIVNSGPPLSVAPVEGAGLRNTRMRLTALYGTRADLQLSVNPDGSARVTIDLPYSVAVTNE